MSREFARYVAVQIVAYALDMGSFLGLVALGLGPLLANVAGKVVAGTAAFFAHRALTFRAAETPIPGQMLRYTLLVVANVPLTSLVLMVLLPLFEQPAPAKFIADVSCVVVTYLLAKHAVFGNRMSAGR